MCQVLLIFPNYLSLHCWRLANVHKQKEKYNIIICDIVLKGKLELYFHSSQQESRLFRRCLWHYFLPLHTSLQCHLIHWRSTGVIIVWCCAGWEAVWSSVLFGPSSTAILSQQVHTHRHTLTHIPPVKSMSRSWSHCVGSEGGSWCRCEHVLGSLPTLPSILSYHLCLLSPLSVWQMVSIETGLGQCWGIAHMLGFM